MTKVPAKYAHDFALLVAAAVAKQRCPKNSPFGPVQTNAVSALRDAGCIRVERYGQDHRVVVILIGQHAGASTEADPRGRAPWMIDGCRTDTGSPRIPRRHERRQQPSPPRLIPAVK